MTEWSLGMVNKSLEEMKESDIEEYDQTLKMFLLATEAATHFLKNDQEFREKFAQIHAEFIKSPESKSVIEESIKAYEKLKK